MYDDVDNDNERVIRPEEVTRVLNPLQVFRVLCPFQNACFLIYAKHYDVGWNLLEI